MVPFCSINWTKFKAFNKKYSVSEFLNLSVSTLLSLEPNRLEEIQTSYYNMMLDKETMEFPFYVSSPSRDEYVTVESRKRGPDNSLQFDRIMKCSRPSASGEVRKKLHGAPYFKVKGYSEEENRDIGERNNCQKVNIPCLTVYSVINCRQTQKEEEGKIISYVNSKILAQVNRIEDPTPKEIEEARDYDSDSNFVMCTFPKHDENGKLLGITEEVCMITVLGDRNNVFFDNDFGGEKNPLLSGYKRSKLPNPLSFMMPSFMQRPMKEGLCGKSKRCEISVIHPNFTTETKRQINIIK